MKKLQLVVKLVLTPTMRQSSVLTNIVLTRKIRLRFSQSTILPFVMLRLNVSINFVQNVTKMMLVLLLKQLPKLPTLVIMATCLKLQLRLLVFVAHSVKFQMQLKKFPVVMKQKCT